MRGSEWRSTIGMDPHEVAGGLCNNGCSSLRCHAPEPLAREANLVGNLRGGSGEGIGPGRQSKQGKEMQSPQ